MSTKAEVLKRLEELGDDDIVAVPVIRTKATAEEIYEYATGASITLTDDEWRDVVADWEDADEYDDEALVESIKFIKSNLI